jgi:hypothetical protein
MTKLAAAAQNFQCLLQIFFDADGALLQVHLCDYQSCKTTDWETPNAVTFAIWLGN